jgi:hypothetical protein
MGVIVVVLLYDILKYRSLVQEDNPHFLNAGHSEVKFFI